MYHGDIRLGQTIDIKFTTRRFSTGAPFTLAGAPVISAYIGNDVTQLTAGITLSVDFDSVTGLNNVRVVASGANGYTTATDVALVITTGTVDIVSVVGEVIGTFSIENRSALMPTTAARTLVVDAAGLADANVVKVGPTGSGTAQTAGDLKASLNTIDDFIDTEIGDIQARLPAALTANGNMKSSLMEILATALTETAGLLAGGFKKFFNVAAPTGTLLSIPDVVAGAANGLFIAGTNAATTITTALTTAFTGNLTGSVGSLAAQAKADVNAEVVDALNVDTYAEPAQGAPGATVSLATKIGFVFKFLRNRVTQDATTLKVYNDDAVTVDHKATVSDSGTVYDRGEIATGP